MSDRRPAWQRVVAAPDPQERDAPAEPEEELPPLHHVPEDRVGDPRENEDWFRRLPAPMQDELRERWRHEEGAGARQRARRHRNVRLYALESAVVYVLLMAVFAAFRFDVLVFAAAFGAGAGALSAVLRLATPAFAAVFFAGFTAAVLLSGLFTDASTNPGSFLHAVFLSIFTLGIGSALGLSHRLQRFDGSE